MPRRPPGVERAGRGHGREQRGRSGQHVSEGDHAATTEPEPGGRAPVAAHVRGDHQRHEADDTGDLHQRAEPGDGTAAGRVAALEQDDGREHRDADEDVVARAADDEHQDHRVHGEERHRAGRAGAAPDDHGRAAERGDGQELVEDTRVASTEAPRKKEAPADSAVNAGP